MSFYIDFKEIKEKKLVSINHFDFKTNLNLALVIGPMSSGKTEFASRVYKDSLVIREKACNAGNNFSNNSRERANVCFIRNLKDMQRFKDYKINTIPYRGGGMSILSEDIAFAKDSFDVKKIVDEKKDYGTFIIDEANFYDESLVFIIKRFIEEQNILFICPTLIYNFRGEEFNKTTKLLLEQSSVIYNLSAYCDENTCFSESFLTYRYYELNSLAIPAPYFDPLLIIGGDEKRASLIYPNYSTRCAKHHILIGREYFYTFLKPYSQLYKNSQEREVFLSEINFLKNDIKKSKFYEFIKEDLNSENENILNLPFMAERALITLFSEYNIFNLGDFKGFVLKFSLNQDYILSIFKGSEHENLDFKS